MFLVLVAAEVLEPGKSAKIISEAANDEVLFSIVVQVGKNRVHRARQTVGQREVFLESFAGAPKVNNLAFGFIGRRHASDQRGVEMIPLEDQTYRRTVHRAGELQVALNVEDAERFSAGVTQIKLPFGRINFDQGRQRNLKAVVRADDIESAQSHVNFGTRRLRQRPRGSCLDIIFANRLPIPFLENRQGGKHPGGLHVFSAWTKVQIHFGEAQPFAHEREGFALPRRLVQQAGFGKEMTALADDVRQSGPALNF